MRNEYSVDRRLYRQWVRENAFRGTKLVFFIVWCVLFLVMAGLAVWRFAAGGTAEGVLFLLMAAFCLYRAFLRDRLFVDRQFEKLSRYYGKGSWTRRIDFEDGGIVLTEEKTRQEIAWDDLLKMTEKDDLIVLRMRTDAAVRLYRSKFTDCEWKDCREKILQNAPQVIQTGR